MKRSHNTPYIQTELTYILLGLKEQILFFPRQMEWADILQDNSPLVPEEEHKSVIFAKQQYLKSENIVIKVIIYINRKSLN